MTPPPARLSWLTRIAWMICAMPELLKSFAWDAFVLFYYAQVVGLNGALIGVAIAVIIVFDTIVDPWIGAFSDRLQGARFGRRHSLMMIGVLPFVIGIYGVFSPPQGMEQSQTLAWLLGFGLMARCGISFWTVPAYALGGELSREVGERSVIAVLRNLGNQLVILTVPAVAFGVFFAPSAAFPKGQLNPAPYPDFGLFVAVLGGVLMVLGIAGTIGKALQLERAEPPSKPQKAKGAIAVLRSLAQAVRITPNVGRLLMVAFLVLFTNSVVNQLSLHLATYYWQLDGRWTPRLLMAGVIGSIFGMIFAAAVARRIGPRRSMIWGLSTFFVVQACAIVLPLIGASPAPATGAMGAFIFVFRFIGGFAYAVYVVPFNMVTYDIGDEHEANTGRPQQGTVASFMFIGLQLSSGAVALLSGSFLGIIDFPVGLPVAEMPADKVTALALFVLSLVVVAGIAMSWLVGRFRVDPEKLAGVRASHAAAGSPVTSAAP